MIHVAKLWRHPIKSHGRESLDRVTLVKGQAMPWDRRWAVTHDMMKDDPQAGVWAASQNFMIGTRTPGLAGIWATLDEQNSQVKLTHPLLGDITFAPDDQSQHQGFLDWVAPLCPPNRSRPVGIAALPERGWTDTDFPSVSIMSMATHRDVEQALARPLEDERWRGNIWLDGSEPWAEFDWLGRTVQIGTATFAIRERVRRCMHTNANPRSGERDIDLPTLLEASFGHRDFGVYSEVIEGGTISIGDRVEVH